MFEIIIPVLAGLAALVFSHSVHFAWNFWRAGDRLALDDVREALIVSVRERNEAKALIVPNQGFGIELEILDCRISGWSQVMSVIKPDTYQEVLVKLTMRPNQPMQIAELMLQLGTEQIPPERRMPYDDIKPFDCPRRIEGPETHLILFGVRGKQLVAATNSENLIEGRIMVLAAGTYTESQTFIVYPEPLELESLIKP